MTHDELERLRGLLEAQRAELRTLDGVSQEAAQPVVLDQSSVGRLSRMDAMQGQAMAIEARRRREQHLMRINAALLRMQGSDYGICLDCDEEIALARLLTDPAATLCIACASKRE